MLDKSPLIFPEGPWKSLLEKALWLMDSIKSDGFTLPRWSLGGGTVLMFYYGHRKSKDIDIFVPDPQFLGYVNPRLGGRGEEVTSDYKDSTEFVKLFLPEGEIDFVASSTLTENPFEEHEVLGRNILLETPIEIVAKKLWYRGDRATPRDLLDLSLVIEHCYNEIIEHGEVFAKNIEAFTDQCASRRSIMLPVFDEIEKIEFKLSFDECLDRANDLKADLLNNLPQHHRSNRLLVPAVVKTGLHCGLITKIEDGFAMQKIGRDPDKIVRHDISKLSEPIAEGDVVDIHYSGGLGKVLKKEISVER